LRFDVHDCLPIMCKVFDIYTKIFLVIGQAMSQNLNEEFMFFGFAPAF